MIHSVDPLLLVRKKLILLFEKPEAVVREGVKVTEITTHAVTTMPSLAILLVDIGLILPLYYEHNLTPCWLDKISVNTKLPNWMI